jgi:hypothetical protein
MSKYRCNDLRKDLRVVRSCGKEKIREDKIREEGVSLTDMHREATDLINKLSKGKVV